MFNKNRLILPCCLLSAALLRAATGGRSANPDSDAVKALIEGEENGRGRNGLEKPTFSAKRRAPIARTIRRSSRPRFSTTFYAIGNQGTVAYVISTSDGSMMIDSLGANQVDTQLLPGFEKLGFDPTTSRPSSSPTGTPIILEDRSICRNISTRHLRVGSRWDLMAHPPAPRSKPEQWPRRSARHAA